jgi:hypothetical protein
MCHCEHCGAELVYSDSYGRFQGGQMTDKAGDIYRCPNHEGFSSEEEARAYEAEGGDGEVTVDWTEITCHSSVHHVSGSYYTDRAGRLHPGYPC